MREMNRRDGTTFIFSTHDPKVMAHANAIVRIEDGRVVGREAAQGAEAGEHHVVPRPAGPESCSRWPCATWSRAGCAR